MKTVTCADRESLAGRTFVALWCSVLKLERLTFVPELLSDFVGYELTLLEKASLNFRMQLG